MADLFIKWRAGIWRANSIFAIAAALVRAYQGNAECFLWALAAFIEWQLANFLLNKNKGEQDGI